MWKFVAWRYKLVTGRYNNIFGAHMVSTLDRVNLKLEWSGRALLIVSEFFCNTLQQYANPTYMDKVFY